jgi:hypothetical protein
LGNNAEKLIENGKKFLKDDFIFNSKEKELLKNVLNSGAVGIAVINKIMEYTNQNYDSIPEIPINTEAMGVPTREDLKRKYLNEKDDFKALEILELAKKNNIKLF